MVAKGSPRSIMNNSLHMLGGRGLDCAFHAPGSVSRDAMWKSSEVAEKAGVEVAEKASVELQHEAL